MTSIWNSCFIRVLFRCFLSGLKGVWIARLWSVFRSETNSNVRRALGPRPVSGCSSERGPSFRARLDHRKRIPRSLNPTSRRFRTFLDQLVRHPNQQSDIKLQNLRPCPGPQKAKPNSYMDTDESAGPLIGTTVIVTPIFLFILETILANFIRNLSNFNSGARALFQYKIIYLT